jgi:tetratricopeptide (TPR) repeat protein
MINADFFILREATCHNDATDQSSHPLHLNKWHYLSLLFIAIFGTYYHIIVHGGFIHLDDMTLLTRLLNEPSFVLKDLFFPHHVTGYYRPMIELSYRLDHLLWFDVASGWHLTNVVLHAINTCLVYLISSAMFANHAVNKKEAAFCAALIYGLNPLAAESVCWVSGRSELILAFFMLSSFSLYLLFKKRGSYAYLFLSGLMYLFAAETKETALVLPLLVVAFEYLFKQGRDVKKSLVVIGYFFLLTAVYFLLFRRAGFDTSNMHVGVGEHGLRTVSFFENVLVLFASLGYYAKKLLFPYPLNIAIDSINLIFYAVLGLCVLVLFALRERFLPPLFRFFAAWMLIAVSPAVAAAVLRLPWVPWAERYLYVPLVGFSMALGLWFTLFKKQHAFAAMFIFVLLTGLFWATTLHRTYVWADEVKLWENTARQSDYGPVHYYYGKSLLYSSREAEGIEQMKKSIDKGYRYDPYLELSMAAFNKDDYEGSERWLKKAIRDFPQRVELHQLLAESYLRRESGKAEGRKLLLKAINEYVEYVTVQKNDAAAWLRTAQLYRAAHMGQRAVPFLKRVIEIDSASPYAKTATKYLQEGGRPEGTR